MTFIASPTRISTASSTFECEFQARLHWSADTDAAIEQRVADILADVQMRGVEAVLDYTARFDGLDVPSMFALELTQAELKAAFEAIPAAQREALVAASKRVRSYHEAQKKANGESWSYRDEDGTLLGQKVTPLDRVGIYVPGGKASPAPSPSVARKQSLHWLTARPPCPRSTKSLALAMPMSPAPKNACLAWSAST